jgi:quinol monooxygenase YgiN
MLSALGPRSRTVLILDRRLAVIYVVATAELKPGTREAFLREFHRNVPNVRAEKGCIEYGPTVDIQSGIKTQIPLREHVVTVVEKWESLEALQAHVVAPHMAAYRERVKDFVVRVSLQVLEPK